MSRGQRRIILVLYLCFCFVSQFLQNAVIAAQVHTERSTKGHQCKTKPDRRHIAASFPELITEGRPFLCSVLSFRCVFVSLPLFIFTAACTFWASHLLFAWLGFFSRSVPLRVLLDTARKVNRASKWIMLPRLRPPTIYDCAEGHLFLFSFRIPLFFCGNFCLDSFPIFIHFQERHNRRLVCRNLNALSGKVRLGASNMT